MKSGKYNGQTKAEFEKNYKRVKDIFEWSGMFQNGTNHIFVKFARLKNIA